MGMSGDFEIAIEEGATVVRVGQAIFGARAMPDAYYWPTADASSRACNALCNSGTEASEAALKLARLHANARQVARP